MNKISLIYALSLSLYQVLQVHSVQRRKSLVLTRTFKDFQKSLRRILPDNHPIKYLTLMTLNNVKLMVYHFIKIKYGSQECFEIILRSLIIQ